jgi:CDP-diacylglycerol--serine O-phosphatidyltransferase
VVSFGLAPAILIIPFLRGFAGRWTPVLAFLFLLCGTIRLARFNVYFQGGEKTGYRGLPITMAGGTLAAYIIFSVELWGRVRSPEFLLLLIVVISALMISTFPYETYPKLTWKGRRNRLKIVLFALCGVAIAVDPPVAFFPLAILYLAMGAGVGLYRFGRSVVLNQLSTKNQGDR